MDLKDTMVKKGESDLKDGFDLKDEFEMNRPFVDSQTPPPGDFELFMGKVDRKRRFNMMFWPAVSVCAAAIAAVLVVWHLSGPSAEKIYSDYLAYVKAARQELSLRDGGGELLDVFDSVADEAVPVIQTLPEDLPESDRTRIIKEHYGNMRNGLESIMASLK